MKTHHEELGRHFGRTSAGVTLIPTKCGLLVGSSRVVPDNQAPTCERCRNAKK